MIFTENDLYTPNRQIKVEPPNLNYLVPKDKKIVKRIPSPRAFNNCSEIKCEFSQNIPAFQ